MQLDLNTKCVTFNNHSFAFVLDEKKEPWFKANPIAAALQYAFYIFKQPNMEKRNHRPLLIPQ